MAAFSSRPDSLALLSAWERHNDTDSMAGEDWGVQAGSVRITSMILGSEVPSECMQLCEVDYECHGFVLVENMRVRRLAPRAPTKGACDHAER